MSTDAPESRAGPDPTKAFSALKWKAAENVAVKLLFLVRTPVLARLLSPDDFGLLAIGLVTLDIMVRLTELGLIPALVQKESPERRHYDVAWSVGVLRASIIAAGVYLMAPLLASVFGEPRATPIIQAMGLRPLLLGLASIGVADLTRNLRFQPLAVLRLSDMGTDAVVSIALAPFIGVWALVAGAIAGPLVRVVVSYLLAPRRVRLVFDRQAAAALVRFGRWIFVSGWSCSSAASCSRPRSLGSSAPRSSGCTTCRRRSPTSSRKSRRSSSAVSPFPGSRGFRATGPRPGGCSWGSFAASRSC
jgi:O-antigen/teichoic acid export membrane protein